MKQKAFSLIELMIVICIIGVLFALVVGATNRETQSEKAVKTSTVGRLLNPDGTPVRPNNDQRKKEPIKEPTSVVDEQCVKGIVYLFVTRDGKNYMAPKEDTFGYNVKCPTS